NQEGKCVLIALPVSKAEAMKSHWFKVKIAFNLKQDEITLKIHDQEKVCKGVLLSDEFSPKIVFGKSDHIIDVPEIAVDKLVVNAEHTYTFPLDEADGESVCNQEGTLYGKVENPIWLINEAYHWRKEGGFASASEAGSCYNADRNEIYYFNRDSLFVYNMETGSTSAKAFAERCPVKLFLAGSFFDSGSERLYAYEVYTENGDSEPMIASLDLHTLGWRVESYSRLSMQLHHHCSYYDAVRKRYTIFGGFGNMYYSNKFYMFNAEEGRWNTLGSLSGDFLCPRYFSSAGYLDSNHSVYIFGGMGNESGDQVIGRCYFHDFYKVDLQEMRVQKLWDISEGQPNMVPAQDMVILNDSCFYVLRYPESVSNSFLHLYRFSVEDGSCHILGDSIPIYSDKITTNARLYYNERQSRLFVTVQETSDDVSSKFSVYSLLFPPVSLEKYTANNGGGNASHVWLVLVAAVVAVAGGSVWIVYKRHRNSGKGEDGKAVRQDKEQLPEASDVKVEKMAVDTGTVNSMYLFGDFSVFDRNGRNISYMFSLRIKQIFCLILRYSDADGISSKQLSDLIWPDKPKVKVKNSRGVAISH
ncbi:Kelch repeat-containing protein, partial [Phocaeicola dorei]